MKTIISLFLLAALLAGCAGVDVERVGDGGAGPAARGGARHDNGVAYQGVRPKPQFRFFNEFMTMRTGLSRHVARRVVGRRGGAL